MYMRSSLSFIETETTIIANWQFKCMYLILENPTV